MAACFGIRWFVFARFQQFCQKELLFFFAGWEVLGMSNVILLIQSLEDAAALPTAIPGLRSFAPDAIWVIHSPAVLVDLSASNAQTDKDMIAIQQAIKDCIGREDYTGAEAYKQQRHALTLQKATAATEGYKTMTPEQQEAATTRVFGAFWEAKPAPKMCLTMHPQHHETVDWIEMVNSLKGAWKGETPHGKFLIGWPGQFVERTPANAAAVEALKQEPKINVAITTSPPIERKPRKPPTGYMGHSRFKQLCSTGIDALGQMALGYKIDPNGKNRMSLAHAIAKHEEANSLLDNPRV